MLITLKAGELRWRYEGTHVWDEKGLALRLEADEEIDIDDAKVDEVLGFVKADREFRGCDPLTGEPLPPPVEPTPEPVVEPIVEPTPEALPEVEVTNV